MRQPILSPDKFLEWFNEVVPGVYRKIDLQDIQDLTDLGLIGQYKYYGRADLETIRAILQYEQLRYERKQKEDSTRTCKRCGQPLTSKSDSRKGRPNEYCQGCEPFRIRERYLDWKARHLINS